PLRSQPPKASACSRKIEAEDLNDRGLQHFSATSWRERSRWAHAAPEKDHRPNKQPSNVPVYLVTDIVIARALHVLAVVIWIGGVSMATTIVLPAVRRGDLGEKRLPAFQAIERRFVWQARFAVIVVGLTGFYMA